MRAVATDGEEPFSHVPVHCGGGLGHEPHEGVLHDIARPVGITAEESGRIAEERGLVARHGRRHQGAGISTIMGWFRFVVHISLLR